MTKTPLLFSLLFLTAHLTSAQSYMGYAMDNYSGLHGTLHNPGNLGDSRTKWDFNLFSVSGTLATDYTNITLNNLTELLGDDGFDGLDRFVSDRNDILLDADILGPSLQFSLNEKSSVALFTRIRVVSNFNNVNGEFLESIYDGFPTTSFAFQQENLDFTTHAWGEVGLSYGRVLYTDSRNMLKGGITMKYLLGGGAVQGSSNNITGNFDDNSQQVALNGDFAYTLSTADIDNNPDYFSELATGLGADIGFVYELRTTKSLAASNANNPRAFNQYKLKIGLSILDLGSINYSGAETSEYSINVNLNAQDLEDDFINALENSTSPTVSVQDQKWALPTSMHLNLDYSFTSKLYLNLNINQGLVNRNEFFNNNRLNLITLTPRFESRIFGAYLPISYSSLSQTALGLGFRVGPLSIGSGSILSNLMGSTSQLANVFLGLKIPVNHKRKL